MARMPIRRIPDAIVKDNILVMIKSYCMEQREHRFESQRKIKKFYFSSNPGYFFRGLNSYFMGKTLR